jgi:penicillin V acylase-like amidase (Ntn superfamily)
MRALSVLILSFLLSLGILVNSALACTAFSHKTTEGIFYAANLDYFIRPDGLVFINRRGISKESITKSPVAKKEKWVSKYGSVTFNIVGRGFVWGGMNEAGLVITMLELKNSKLPEPDKRPPLNIGVWTQYVLDTCSTVQEVIEVDSRVRPANDGNPSQHWQVTDATGNTAVIEYQDGRLVVYTEQDLPVQALSNMPYGLALEAYKRGGHPWWRWGSNPGQSAERFATAARRMQNFDPAGGAGVIDYSFKTLLMVSAPHTKWSAVYDIANRGVWFGSAASPTGKYISLKSFDLSCGAPLMMLKVDSSIEGNVEKNFIPYNRDTNLEAFNTYSTQAGLAISPEEIADLMQTLESFTCAQ